jgi:hypothetical protein
MSALAAAAIGAGGAIIGGAFKFFEGASQKKQAAQIAKNNPFSPEAMPYQVGLQTKLAQENYTNGMPGEVAAKQGIQQNAANAQANAVKGATSSGDVLDASNKIGLGADDATRKLALQAASYKSNALGGYEAALGQEAGWTDQLYKNNQLQPYLRAANTAASLQGAGAINEAGGIDEAVTGAMAGGQEYGNAKYAKFLASTNPNGNPNSYASSITNPYTNNLMDTPNKKNSINSLMALSALYNV